MSINALNFFLFLNCFATTVSQLKIMISQWEPIKLVVFQPPCTKIGSSTVLTDNTLEPVSKHWHWQLPHQIWRELPTKTWTASGCCHIRWWNTGRVFSFWQRLGDGEYPKSILADRASHVIPQTHHIASRHQIHQDTKPNWRCQPHIE